MSNLGAGVEAEETELATVSTGAVVVLVATDAESSVAARGEEEMVEEAWEALVVEGLVGAEGEEKKEVMEALALGFLAVDVAMSAALRFNGVAMIELDDITIDGQ